MLQVNTGEPPRLCEIHSNVPNSLQILGSLQELPQARYASQVAISSLPSGRGRRVMYSHVDLYKMVEEIASKLRENGISPGTVCAIALPNSIEALVYLLAVVWIGAIAAPIDINMCRADMEEILRTVKASTLVSQLIDEDEQEENYIFQTLKIVAENLQIIKWHIHRTINEGVILETHGRRAAEGAAWAGGASELKPDPNQNAMIFAHLSEEKTVSLHVTHENFTSVISNFAIMYELGSETATVLMRPWISQEVIVHLLATMYTGGHVIIPGDELSPDGSFHEFCIHHKVDWFSTSSTFLTKLIDSGTMKRDNVFSFIHVTGDDLDASNIEKISEDLNTRVLQTYGIPETISVASCTVHDNHKPSTRGHVAPECGIQIFDRDTFDCLGFNSNGIVGVSSFNAANGYIDSKLNEAMIVEREGVKFFLTDYIGRIDEKGYLQMNSPIKGVENLPMTIDRAKKLFRKQGDNESFSTRVQVHEEAGEVLEDLSKSENESSKENGQVEKLTSENKLLDSKAEKDLTEKGDAKEKDLKLNLNVIEHKLKGGDKKRTSEEPLCTALKVNDASLEESETEIQNTNRGSGGSTEKIVRKESPTDRTNIRSSLSLHTVKSRSEKIGAKVKKLLKKEGDDSNIPTQDQGVEKKLGENEKLEREMTKLLAEKKCLEREVELYKVKYERLQEEFEKQKKAIEQAQKQNKEFREKERKLGFDGEDSTRKAEVEKKENNEEKLNNASKEMKVKDEHRSDTKIVSRHTSEKRKEDLDEKDMKTPGNESQESSFDSRLSSKSKSTIRIRFEATGENMANMANNCKQMFQKRGEGDNTPISERLSNIVASQRRLMKRKSKSTIPK